MIVATAWEIRCDHKGCGAHLADHTEFGLRKQATAAVWQIGVRRDGKPAMRNGKDYCPAHPRSPATVVGVANTPLYGHLVELLDSPNPKWHPKGSGEWACARTAHTRGLLHMHQNVGELQSFSLTEAGRELAAEVKARRRQRRQ